MELKAHIDECVGLRFDDLYNALTHRHDQMCLNVLVYLKSGLILKGLDQSSEERVLE